MKLNQKCRLIYSWFNKVVDCFLTQGQIILDNLFPLSTKITNLFLYSGREHLPYCTGTRLSVKPIHHHQISFSSPSTNLESTPTILQYNWTVCITQNWNKPYRNVFIWIIAFTKKSKITENSGFKENCYFVLLVTCYTLFQP